MARPPISFSSLLTLACILTFAPSKLSAHPASILLPKKSLAEKIDENPDVVLARPTRLENPQFRITAVLKTANSPRRGDVLDARISKDPEAPAEIDNLFTSVLLTRKNPEDDWIVQSPAGLHLTPFFRQLIELPADYANSDESYRDRLRFFLPLIAHPDTRIANSAVAAIGRAPFNIVRLLKSDLDREELRAFIDDPKHAGWRSLQFILLGIRGNKEDAAFFRERLEAMWEKNEFANLASMFVAYIELAGVEAADFIFEKYLKDRERTFVEIKEALVALAMQGDERHPLPRQRVIEIFGWLMENRKPMVYLVIPDYMRWEYWDVMPELAALAGEYGFQFPYLRKRTIDYLKACPNPEARRHISALPLP